jgi:hypothetical protein
MKPAQHDLFEAAKRMVDEVKRTNETNTRNAGTDWRARDFFTEHGDALVQLLRPVENKTALSTDAEPAKRADLIKRLLDIGSMHDDQHIARTAYDAVTALSTDAEPVAWIYEDELPENYPYDAMFPYSKVDGVRLFPVYAPLAAQVQDVAIPEGWQIVPKELTPKMAAELNLTGNFSAAAMQARYAAALAAAPSYREDGA